MQNRVMLSGDSGENATKTISRSIISKKTTARAAHLFCTIFWCCFARLQRETCRTFLVTHFTLLAVKPRANGRKIVGQQLPTLLGVVASVCTLLKA